MAEKFKLVAPVDGKCVDITEVPDDTFSAKVLGDGVAFIYDGDTVCAPCAGEVTMVAETNHAVAITSDGGMEILIHVGLDTVNLGGKGLEALVKAGQKVKIGTPLIRIDRAFMKTQNVNLITPLILTNGDDTAYELKSVGSAVKQGKDTVVTYDGIAEEESAPAAAQTSGGGKYDALVTTIIENVGGKDNVDGVTHCVTRLRFKLKDESKANTQVLQNTKGVMQVISTGGQYQVVVGPAVDEIYAVLIDKGGFNTVETAGNDADSDNNGEKQSIISRL